MNYKVWWNTSCDRTQNMTKQKIYKQGLRLNKNCDITKILTKHKLWQNTNCDEHTTCDQTLIVREKRRRKNYTNTNCDKTQIVTKYKMQLNRNSKKKII